MDSVSIMTKRYHKKPRLVARGVDRLTNLHDSLLSEILSRLPSKDSVRTSVLSKNWQRKWTLARNVDIDASRGLTFARFMDEMIVNREHLRTLRATFNVGMKDNVQRWIDGAMRHDKLEILDVNIIDSHCVFPVSLFNSKSLRELKVVVRESVTVEIDVAEKNCAPNLASLLLYRVAFVNRDLKSSSVSFEFPALERLGFSGTVFSCPEWMNVKSVEMYAPSMTSFLFQPSLLDNGQDPDYTTMIFASKLTKFSSLDGLPGKLIMDGSSVVSAFLSGRYNTQGVTTNGARARDLLNGFTNLEELTLSSSLAEVLLNEPPLHSHDKLRRLTVQGNNAKHILRLGSTAKELFKLLHAMPSLEFLSVYMDYDYDFEATEMIPSCIACHLEEVVFHLDDYGNFLLSQPPIYNLASLLLKAATRLKKFTIMGDPIFSKHLKDVLSTFVHASPSVEIFLPCFGK